jgi:GNAT superfamily N-acetyltransferase
LDYSKRIIKTFSETPIFQDVHLGLDRKNHKSEEYDAFYYDQAKKGRLIKKSELPEFRIELYNRQDTTEVFAINKSDNSIAGMLSATIVIYKFFNDSELPSVESVYVYKEFQKKGVGMAMYDILISSYGGCLSDRVLTGDSAKGSFNIWERLAKKYNAYYVGKTLVKGEFHIYKVDSFIRDMMHSPNDRFLVTLKPLDVDKLQESPQLDDDSKEIANRDIFKPPLRATLKLQYETPTPIGKALIQVYEFVNKVDKQLNLKLDSGEVIAMLEYNDDISPEIPFPVIEFTAVKKEYRGKGISKVLYEFIIRKFKGIISDVLLSGSEGYGSFQLWQSLSKKYHPYIIDFDNSFITPSKSFEKWQMKTEDERFMLTQYPFDYTKHNEERSKFKMSNIKFTGTPLKSVSESPQLMAHTGDRNSDVEDLIPSIWDWSGKPLMSKDIGSGLTFMKMKGIQPDDFKYCIRSKETVICGMRGKISDSDYKVAPTEFAIGTVLTDHEYRRQGYAKQLYRLVLQDAGILVSDYQLYPGTASIWQNYLPTIAHMYLVDDNGKISKFNFKKGTGKVGFEYYFVASVKPLL